MVTSCGTESEQVKVIFMALTDVYVSQWRESGFHSD